MKMEINEAFIPEAKECVEIEELDDGCILYNTEKEDVHSLNITAAAVWTCCDGRHSIKEIATIMGERFNPGRKLIIEDIIKIVKDFSEKGLLRR